jgi:hypothetical protein
MQMLLCHRFTHSHIIFLSQRYYTQTRAIGAFASVGVAKLLDASTKACLECAGSCACWGKPRSSDVLSVIRLRRSRAVELEQVVLANDDEADHTNLIQREQV